MIAAVQGRLQGLNPWPRAMLSFALGLASTFAMPPWHQVWLLWLIFPALIWMLAGCRTWSSAAAVGWAFGFGHFIIGLHWIANAFYVDADTHGAFALPAVAALCAICALYIAAVTLITWRATRANDRVAMLTAPIVFALAWVVMEWVRGWLFTGFPWIPASLVWTAWPGMIQITAVIGTLGLSLLTVLGAASIAVIAAPVHPRTRWLMALAPTIALAVSGIAGTVRINAGSVEMVPGVVLRLVQPNIAQADKWKPGMREQHFMDHIALSTNPGVERVTHVIWGEAAVAYALDQDETRRFMAVGTIRAAGANLGALITGVPRGVRKADGSEQVFNSLLVVRGDGTVSAVYDKTHLVPFGEYLPLRGLIPFRKLTEGTMDFSPGPGRTTMDVAGLPPFSPLICYEAIFSGAVTGPPKNGATPRWMLNVTNDSWFGDSSGPRQHLAQAQLRAVEEGLPLVRVANTGISAVIDPYGRILGRIPLNEKGTLDSGLPKPVVAPTWFSRTGQLTPLILILSIIGGVGVYTRRARHPT